MHYSDARPAGLLSSAGVIAVGLLVTVWMTGASSSPFTDVSPDRRPLDTLRAVSQQIFRLTNQERTNRNLDSLKPEMELRRVACQHTRDMMVRDFIQHENPDGESPSDRVARMHRRLIGEAGENLWERKGRRTESSRALAEKIVDGWMNSPPHRKNILRPRFSHLGVCTLSRGKTVRGTQVFADVRGYLRDPLPRTAAASSPVAAPIDRTFPPDAVIAKYDFWDPHAEESITEPRIFTDTLWLPDKTGAVRPRFYVPEPNRYQIHWGPEIRLTAPE